jgi:uncharacterized damage-inducible protein DinB
MPGTPGPVADERAGLIAFLAQQHLVLRITAHGLTDSQARSSASVSTLTVGGLIKHVTAVEEGWMASVLAAPARPPADPRPMEERAAEYGSDFVMTDEETLADILSAYDDRCRRTLEALATVDLDTPVPVPPAPWNPKDIEAWSVRWVLLHLIEEIARHAGHADIIRESIDGATAYPLMAAVEGWPETPWVTPWRRPEDAQPDQPQRVV